MRSPHRTAAPSSLLSPADRELPQSLVTVTPGFALAGSVPLPRVADVWGVHALPDGAVAVTGRLADGYGLEVVDPVTGTVRTTVLAPACPAHRLGIRPVGGPPDGARPSTSS